MKTTKKTIKNATVKTTKKNAVVAKPEFTTNPEVRDAYVKAVQAGKLTEKQVKEFKSAYTKTKNVFKNMRGKIYEGRNPLTADQFFGIVGKILELNGKRVTVDKKRIAVKLNLEMRYNWLWVTGDTKPVHAELKKMGLLYSPKNQAWFSKLDKGIKTA